VENRRSQWPVACQLALLCLPSGYFRIWDGHAMLASCYTIRTYY